MDDLINAVIIDDNLEDIIGIGTALAKKGLASIPVHYTSPRPTYEACKLAALASPRVIITDIQMNDGGREPSRTDLGNVAKCLEQLVDNISGPYVILAWTSIAESFDAMRNYVETYFTKKSLRPPIYFASICKNECKPDGNEYCAVTILKRLTDHLVGQSQLRALMHWEKTVLKSAVGSVNQIIANESQAQVKSSLSALAIEVAGSNLTGNEAAAINEALTYILKDKLAHFSISEESQSIWADAIDVNSVRQISSEAKATLNTSLHIDFNCGHGVICPGDVWIIQNEPAFFQFLSATKKQDELKNNLLAEFYDDLPITNAQLIAMEISPACDFAQGKKSLKSLAIGLLVPIQENTVPNRKNIAKRILEKKKDTVLGVRIIYNEEPYILCILRKYSVSMTADKIYGLEKKIGNRNPVLKKILRLRESLLISWIQSVAVHVSRIGTISFK